MDKGNDNKNKGSPSVPKKIITVKKSNSERSRPSRNWAQVSNEVSFRNLFLSKSVRKRNAKEEKREAALNNIENEANLNQEPNSTQVDAGIANPSTNEIESKLELLKTYLEPHSENYYMKHKNRGKAIIFNHETFDKRDTRYGTKYDVEKLKEVLSILKFDVQVHTDLECSHILNLLKQLSTEDHSNNDCIAFFVLTHGKKKKLSAKDMEYPIEWLWDHFTADKCTTLAGKPKLFFISACRGKQKGLGMKFFQKNKTETDSAGDTQTFSIPNHADFLIAYSTLEGYVSFRDTNNGTWFIQKLCATLLEHHTSKDLLKMLTITSRKVAIDCQSQEDEDCDKKQIPLITSMLIRDVYFNEN